MKTKPTLLFTLIATFLLLLGCSNQKTNLKGSDSQIQSQSKGKNGSTYSQVLREQAYKRYLSGEFLRAIDQFEAYLVLEPEGEDQWIKYLLYYSYMAVGEYERALKLAKDLVKLKPYDFLSYQQVGLAQLWLGQVRGALTNFKRSLEFESHLPQVSFYQGLAYGKLRQFKNQEASFKEAESEYNEILTSNPKDFNANYELARLYLYWDHDITKVPNLMTTAKESLSSKLADEDVLKEETLYLNFHIPLLEGIYLYRTKTYQKSLHLLLAALVNAPMGIHADLAELYFYLGQNYQALEQFGKAQAFLEKAKRVDPRGMYADQTTKQLRSLASKAKKKR